MPWDSAGNYTPPGGWLGKTKAAGSDGDGGSKSTTTLRSDGSGWDESGNYTPPGGWLGKQKQDQQQKQQQQNESFANQAQQADAQRAQLEGQSFENVPEHTPGGGKFAALAPVTPNITDGRNWWDKTRDFVKSALTGDVRDQIGAALTETGQGAIAGVPFAEQLTNRMIGDETGQTSKRIHEENAQLIGETATKAFHAAGMIGSMVMGGEVLAPVKGLQGLNLFNTAKTGQGMLRAALPALEETAAGRALNTAANAAIYGMGNEVVRGYTDPNAERNPLTDLGAGTRGLADVGSGFGKAMTWASNPDQTGVLGTSARALGLDHLGKHLDAASQTYGEGFQRDFGAFGWKSFLNPSWYAYNVGRMLPFTVAMLPAAVVGAEGMGAVLSATGIDASRPFLSHVLKSLAAGAATAPLEAAVEAGQVYEDVYKQGIAKISFDGGTPTKEQLQQIGHEANRASNKGFWLNTGVLAAFNAGEFATLFMPKGVSRFMDSPGGRIGFGAVNEGAQESTQQVIQNYAEGKPLMDPSVIEQGALGAIFGGVMAGAGHVSAGQEHHEPQAQQQPKQGGKLEVEITPPTRKFAPTRSMSGIQDRTLAKLDPVDQADLNERLAEARTLGLPEAQVKQEALDALAQHPDGQQMIDEAVQEEMQSQANQQLASMTPEQMQAHADAMQQQHVMAEPDVPGNVPGNVPADVPADVHGNVPGNAPDNVPGNVPGNVPDNVPGGKDVFTPEEIKKLLTQTGLDEQDMQQAKDIIQQTGNASIATLLQHMKIGYTSAAMLIDQLEAEGFIGPYEAGNGRKIFGEQSTPTQQPQQQAPAPQQQPKAPAYKPAVGDKVRLKGRPNQTYTVQDASDRSMVVLDNGMKVGHAALEPVMNENEPGNVLGNVPGAAAQQPQTPAAPIETRPMTTGAYANVPGAREEVIKPIKGTGQKMDYTMDTTKTGQRRIIVSRGNKEYVFEVHNTSSGDRVTSENGPRDKNDRRKLDLSWLHNTNPDEMLTDFTGLGGAGMPLQDFVNYLEGRDYTPTTFPRHFRDLPENFNPTHVFEDGRKVQATMTPDGRVTKWIADDGQFGTTATDDFKGVPLNQQLGDGQQTTIQQARQHLDQFARNDYVTFTHEGKRMAGRILNGGSTTHNVQLLLLDENQKPIDDIALPLTDPAILTLTKSSRAELQGFKSGNVIDVPARDAAPTVTDNAPAEVVQPEQQADVANTPPVEENTGNQQAPAPAPQPPPNQQKTGNNDYESQNFPRIMEDPAKMSDEDLEYITSGVVGLDEMFYGVDTAIKKKWLRFAERELKRRQNEKAGAPAPQRRPQQAPAPQEQPKGGVTSGTADDVRTDGQGPLEETPADHVPGAATDGAAANGAAERPASNGAGDGSNGAAANGEAANTQEREPVGESTAAGNDTPAGVGNGAGDVGAAASGDGRKGGTKRTPESRLDFVITNELDELGGVQTKFKNNVLAIRTLRQIENDGRLATPEEQAILAKYVGWGGLSDAFNPDNKKWEKQYSEVRSLVDAGLITEQEYEDMRQTTQYAHYTSKEIIGAMYTALNQFGFTGGRVLEPAAGVGNFFGLMPQAMANNSTRTGVEKDPISGRIAKQLYQKANIQIKPFESYVIPNGHFDVAIGNPPFSGKVSLTYGGKGKNGKKLLLHNYFFMQSLDKVRDGGIVAFITSSGTMNARTNNAVRDMILQKANFLGAIRLPGDAFKKNAGTEVTTDIIFLQKRAEGEAANHTGGAAAFIGTVKQNATRDSDGKTFSVDNSKYFADHPDMVLGEYTVDRLTGTRLGVKADGRNFAEALNQAVSRLPKEIYVSRQQEAAEDPVFDTTNSYAHMNELDQNGYAIKDGKLLQRIGDTMIDVKFDIKHAGTRIERIKAMIPIRDTARSLIRAMRDPNTTDAQIEGLQRLLNDLYDAYVKKNGFLNRPINVTAFKSDSLGAGLLMSLESPHPDQKDTYVKEAIFSKRTIKVLQRSETADTAEEALTISLFETGQLNFDRMSELTGKPKEQLIADLAGKIYLNPVTTGWETEDEYLSGNVRAKLLQAQDAARRDASLQPNVEALKAVQPVDLTPTEIKVRLGSSWVPPEVMEQFIADFLNEPFQKIRVFYTRMTATWTIEGGLRNNTKNTDEYGVKNQHARDVTALDLIEDSLNMKPTTVTYKDEKDKTVVDQDASNQARRLQEQINAIFVDWIWSDEQRAAELSDKYNWEFNSIRLREYNGELIYGKAVDKTLLPGQSDKFPLLKHQRNGVWRTVQGGNTLLAHVVGAGKTFTIAASAMEMKRLGLINKPMIVVPTNLLEQWEKEFYQLYPGAKLLKLTADDVPSVLTRSGQVTMTDREGNPMLDADGKPLKRLMTNDEYIGKRDQHRAERAAALAKIAVGSYDAILISHETFGRLPMSPESVNQHIHEQIEEVEEAIRGAKEDDANSPTVKQLEAMKESLAEKLRTSIDEENKDVAIPFEELGVDQLYVDEAHKFKNLMFHTKMRNVAGLPKTNSARATDMYLKTRYLSKLRGGRGVVFATGTPIANTMAEMFTLWRYLMYDRLEGLGMRHFDAWASTFGETVSDFEQNAAGQHKTKTRFSRFRNVPELMTIFKGAADIQTADMLDLPTPDNVHYETITAPRSPEQTAYMQELVRRAENMQNVDPRTDNWLKLTSNGREMALDIKLVRPGSREQFADTKLNRAIDKMTEIYFDQTIAKGKDGSPVDKHTQLVFVDLGTPKKKDESDESQDKDPEDNFEQEDAASVSVYEGIRRKLVAKGIPEAEIAFIHEANTKTRRRAMFDKVNRGEVRFLIGSTEKMGAGMNVQQRLVALHHIDAPWRPADVEQREGRIIRQGNLNNSIYVYDYVTKDTFDQLMWDTLKRKAYMINQVMNGTSEMRSIEDVEATTFRFAETAAAASGNPLIQEKLKVEKEVNDLSGLKTRHERTRMTLRKELVDLPKNINNYERWHKEQTDDKQAAQAHKGNQVLVIDGVTYEKPKNAPAVEPVDAQGLATEATKEPSYRELGGQKLMDTMDAWLKRLDTGEQADIGTFNGFTLKFKKTHKTEGRFYLYGPSGTNEYFDSSDSPAGQWSRMVNTFHKFADYNGWWQDDIDKAKKRMEAIKPLVDRPFESDQQLMDATARLEDIMRQLIQLNQQHEQVGQDAADENEQGGELSLAATPAGSGRVKGKGSRKMRNVVTAGIKETKNVLTPQVSGQISDMIAKALNTVVNEDFVKRGAQGVYSSYTKAAAVKGKSYFEWRVVGHELGHVFSDFYAPGKDRYSGQLPIKEMQSLALALYPNPRSISKLPVKMQVEEGFAEFFRQWVADPLLAAKNAPQTAKMFESFIAADKELTSLFSTVRTLVDNDLQGTAVARAVQGIITSEFSDDNDLYGVQYKARGLSKAQFEYLDYTVPAKALMKAARKMGTQVKVDLAKLMAVVGDAHAKAKTTFESQAKDHEGRYLTGRVLETIYTDGVKIIGDAINWSTVKLATVDKEILFLFKQHKKMDAKKIFDAILIAKRIQERADNGFEKLPMPVEMADEIIDMAETRFPDAVKFAEEYASQLSHVILEKLERAGILTPEARERIEAGSKFYIPFYYDTKNASKSIMTGRTKGGRTNKVPVKRFKGKVAPILDPFQASMMKLTEVEQAIEYKRVISTIHQLAKTEGLGTFARIVPRPQQAIQLSTEQVMDRIIGKLDEDVDISGVMADKALTFFLPAGLEKTEGKPVIMNMVDGKQHFIELAPDIFNMLMAIKPPQVEFFGRMLAQMARLTRYTALVTGTYIVNAAVRDQATALIQSKDPLKTVFWSQIHGAAAAMGLTAAQADKLYADYINSGGFSSAAVNVINSQVGHIFNESLLKLEAPGWNKLSLKTGKKVLVKVLHTPEEIIRFFEEMPRLAEFVTVWRKEVAALGYDAAEMHKLYLDQGTDALPAELQEEIERISVEASHAAAEVTVNFRIRGRSEALRKYTPTVPFLHGTVQGAYRTARVVRHPKEHAKGLAIGMPTLTLIALVAWLIMQQDDDDRKNLADMDSTTRDKYWIFPNPFVKGTYLHLGKPFDFALPVNVFERWLDQTYGGPGARKMTSDVYSSLLGTFTKTQLINSFLQVIIDVNANKTQLGGPIVPQKSLGRPVAEQSGPATSETAKFVANLLAGKNPSSGISPYKMDYFIRQTFGRWGTFGMKLSDMALVFAKTGNVHEAGKAAKGTAGVEYAPIIGQLVTAQEEGSSRTVERFYRDLNTARTISNSANDRIDAKSTQVPPWATPQNLQLLYFKPALEAIADEMAANRKAYDEAISKAETPTLRRKFVDQKDYLDKLAAAVLYGIEPAAPSEESGVTQQMMDQLKAELQAKAQKAIINEQKRKGGATDQLDYLSNVLNHTYVPTK